MRMDPEHRLARAGLTTAGFSVWGLLTAAALVVGLTLLVDTVSTSSATYDEVAYLKVAARWWRTGDQSEITRMGSPLLFWKLQQVPVLWALDHLGQGAWVEDPIGNQRQLLPLVRLGSLWIWLLAATLTTLWSRHSLGPRAMALAAWLFALSPNLIAHGALATMELPLVAATTAMCALFWRFLDTTKKTWFWSSAAAGGVAFSCKYTAILFPPILAVVWWVALWRRGDERVLRPTRRVASYMLGFMLIMLLSNLVVTDFARIPLSKTEGRHPTLEKWFGMKATATLTRLYETPLPQDWVGFATQVHHQASGGASYLWGERRTKGWWYYYFVALAFKVPLGLWLLVCARLAFARSDARNQFTNSHIELLPLVVVLFLAITAVGSSRNYGMRYLLPLAPLSIVWVSALAECKKPIWPGLAATAGLAGFALAIAASHPHELTYFNILAGGPRGGRRILSDSNLDWGQGLCAIVRLQKEQPDFRDITFYYFGDTHPAYYGVAGRSYMINAALDHTGLPGLDQVDTRYLAVSSSLQWGPWGPPGFFRDLDRLEPVCFSDDTTVAIYRTAELRAVMAKRSNNDRRVLIR
ncbi:MAG TPA: glycosyltransferase family 39 protein [Isosphaeraceae bacterium]|nr:glycosyltransferase family 39 protein [Isosphaeraceae bacterium]